MILRDFIALLQKFPDQECEVQVVDHTGGRGWYDQGGNVTVAPFSKERHMDYTDFRGNQFVKSDAAHYSKRYLLIGHQE